MLPNPDRGKDWISHKLFWARTGFKDPYSSSDQAEFARCDAQCTGKEHEATATTDARTSYCTLPIFHPPQPLNWTGAGNGYVSADGHAFACVNPNNIRQSFHVIFVLDRSSSMSERDRIPLPNAPCSSLISRYHNNRFGAVLSSLYGFWNSHTATGCTRRDSYTVIVFNEESKIIVDQDHTSSPDQLLNKVLATSTSGKAYFDGASKKAQTCMENNWAADRAPAIIFLSNGECNASDSVIYDLCNKAVELGSALISILSRSSVPFTNALITSQPLSLHAVLVGNSRRSEFLRRMATIAEQVARIARTSQPVPCGYTETIDTIRLPETSNLAASFTKPKASLIRQ
ncbi:hypothetical protein FRC02_002744 [Tulasnella sp. 418]|nr:hypothetical protein FRC02_002744 [Tulasnella sp. 418]